MHSFILIINLYRSFSLVRFVSTNYIRTRCHPIISHFTMSHKCRYCGLSFTQNKSRLRHERNWYADDQSVRCVFCEQNFQETTDLHHHVDNVHRDGTFSCSTCSKTFSVKRYFQVHQSHCTSRPTSPQPGPSQQFRCHRCTQSFDDRRQLYLHGMRHLFQTGEGVGLQSPPWEENTAPWC